MGHRGFGNLTKVNKQVYYGLSSFEQRIFPGYFSKGIPNTLRRIRGQLFRVTPGFAVGYLTYYYAMKEFDAANRKNAAEFASDK